MGRPPGAKNKKQNHQLPIATKSAAAAGSVQATAEAVNRFAPPDFSDLVLQNKDLQSSCIHARQSNAHIDNQLRSISNEIDKLEGILSKETAAANVLKNTLKYI